MYINFPTDLADVNLSFGNRQSAIGSPQSAVLVLTERQLTFD